jgi:hypothetical protein
MRSGLVLAAGTVLSLAVASLAVTGDQTLRVAPFLATWGLAFAAYLVALIASPGLSRTGVRLALGAAIAWRLVLVLAPPLLSDDVYRSVWEGRVQLHGGNPYRWSERPEAERWVELRDEVWRGVNHKEYSAIYPPLWQLAAWGVAAVSDTVVAMKLFVVACELAALALLGAALRARGQPPQRLLVMAWSPLALVEIAGSGHNDALGLLAVAAALLALSLDRPGPLAAALTAGIGAKLLPGLLAVAWLRRLRPRHLAGIAAGCLALTLPYYLGAGSDLWLSLDSYSRFWRFNESLFAPLAELLGHEGAVRAGALLTLGAALLAWHRGVEPVAAGTLVVVAWLALGPNVLPWYALWLLPLLVLRDEPGALLLTGTVALAYLVLPTWQSGERWQVGWGARSLEYAPCIAVAVVSRLRSRSAA